MKISLEKYLDAVRSKLQDPVVKKSLMFGSFSIPGAPILRDEMGYVETCNNIMQIAKNFYNLTQGNDALADRIANFSQAGAQYADVSRVNTVGAIDVTILNYSQSLVPYVCVDRGLPTPSATIYFNSLVATNDAGGVTAGTEVIPNFAPPSAGVNLGPARATGSYTASAAVTSATATTIATTKALTPGQVVVTLIVKAGGTGALTRYEGRDFTSNGHIYFPTLPAGTTTPTAATVSYSTGEVVITSEWLETEGFLVDALIDGTADATHGSLLRVRPLWTPVQLITEPHTIILENNIANILFMDKTSSFATGATGRSYADMIFSKVTEAYTQSINVSIIRAMVGALATNGLADLTMDLSSYSVANFAETKNDLVNQFMINLRTKFLQQTGIEATCIVTGSNGVSLLEGHPTKWVRSDTTFNNLNGIAGFYDKIPVFRHNYLDVYGTSATGADFLVASKLPDNQSGSIAFGEFIPVTNSGAVGNYINPVQQSNALFSQHGVKIIQDKLIRRGTIALPTSIYSA